MRKMRELYNAFVTEVYRDELSGIPWLRDRDTGELMAECDPAMYQEGFLEWLEMGLRERIIPCEECGEPLVNQKLTLDSDVVCAECQEERQVECWSCGLKLDQRLTFGEAGHRYCVPCYSASVLGAQTLPKE